MGLSPSDSFSIESIVALRGEAFAQLRELTDRIRLIGDSVETVDAALQIAITDKTVDDRQELITAARNLSALLDTTTQVEFEFASATDLMQETTNELRAARLTFEQQALELPRMISMASGQPPYSPV